MTTATDPEGRPVRGTFERYRTHEASRAAHAAGTGAAPVPTLRLASFEQKDGTTISYYELVPLGAEET
jgi:hypothetical protein